MFQTTQCPDANPDKIDVQRKSYFLYELEPLRDLPVKSCKLEATYQLFHCGAYSHNSLIESSSILSPVDLSVADCRNLWLNKVYIENGQTVAVAPGVTEFTIYLAGHVYDDGTCDKGQWIEGQRRFHGVVYKREYRLLLTPETVFYDITTHQLQQSEMSHCDMRDRGCAMPGRTVIFDPPSHRCQLTFLRQLNTMELHGQKEWPTKMKHKPDYTATPIIIVSKMDGVIFRRGELMPMCDGMVYRTNYKALVLSTSKLAQAQEFISQTVRWHLYINNKLDFTRYIIEDNIRLLYYNVVSRFCQIEGDIFRIRLALAYNDPQMAGLLLTGKPGISAVVAGEVFYFYRCQRVSVKLAKSHHKCIQELPVEYNNSVYFMSPLTKILTSQPTISECSPVHCCEVSIVDQLLDKHSFVYSGQNTKNFSVTTRI